MSIKNLSKNQFKFTSVENSSSHQNPSEEVSAITPPPPEEIFQGNDELSKLYPGQTGDQVLSRFFYKIPPVEKKRNYNDLPTYFAPTLLAIAIVAPLTYIAYEGFTDSDSFPKLLESLEIKSKGTPNP
jgi:hypothetical protein